MGSRVRILTRTTMWYVVIVVLSRLEHFFSRVSEKIASKKSEKDNISKNYIFGALDFVWSVRIPNTDPVVTDLMGCCFCTEIFALSFLDNFGLSQWSHFFNQILHDLGSRLGEIPDFPKSFQLWWAVSPSSLKIFSKFQKIFKDLCLNFHMSLITSKTDTWRER